MNISLPHLFQQPWMAQLGWTLLHFLWQGTLISVVFAVVRALAGQSLTARARYTLACLTLAIMMATPVVTFVTAERTDGVALAAMWPKTAGGWQQSLPWLVAVRLAGVIVFTFRLIGGWRLTSRLRSVATGPVPSEWQETLEDLIRRMRISTPVRLLTSSLVAVPTVVGWLRPVILMPIGALAGLPLDQVEALLAHELAHIRRQDYVVNILQSIAEAVLFYHPAVWWVSEQIRAERETCCDDIAVEASGDVLVYVRALADLESNRRAQLKLKTALAADGGSLVHRIRRLVVQQPQRASHNLAGSGAAWVLSILWLAAIGAATVHAAPGTTVRKFIPPQRTAMVRVVATTPLQAPPDLKIVSSPALTALMFDPFFAPPQAPVASPAGVPATTDTSEQSKISVSGTVMSTAKEPVKKAAVRLQMIGGPAGQMPFSYMESTDDAGKFTIENIAPGTYSLTATKMGFVGGAYGARAAGMPGATVTLNSGSTLRNLDLTLTPQGIIAGRVTNQDGDPVTRVQAALFRVAYNRGRRVVQMGMRGQTNDLGDFSIANVTPGRYYLQINSGTQPPDMKPGMGDVSTFYPDSLDTTNAVLINVAAGARVEGMNVRLRREHIFAASGKVTYQGAQVTGNIVLEFAPKGSGGSITAGTARFITVTGGQFTIRNLFPGTYDLAVSRSVAGEQLGPGYSGHLEFTVTDSDLKDLTLDTTPGVAVSGTFNLDGGKWSDLYPQVAAATQQGGATPPVFYPSIGLVDPVVGFFQNPMRVSAEGKFTLRTVPAERYLLDITGLPQGTYVKSIRYGNQDVTRSPVDFVVGGATLDVTLSKNAATVSGVLRDNNGTLSGVQVTMWPKTPNPGLGTGGVRSVYTDQNGGFKFGNLAPGDYWVAAWEEIDSGLAQAPDFLGHFTSQAASVTLSESSQSTADVKMIPKDAIAKEALSVQ